MEPTSNNSGIRRPQTTGMRGRYITRPRVQTRRSVSRIEVENVDPSTSGTYINTQEQTPVSNPDFYAEESTGAREITPVDPVSDFQPVNPDVPPAAEAPKPKGKGAFVILAILFLILGFAGGLCLGLNWDKIFAKKEAPKTETPTTSDSRDLTDAEKADLSKKIAYLTMADLDKDSYAMGYYRFLPKLTSNTLSDSDKLGITVYSLRDEYVSPAACATDPSLPECAEQTVSAERVSARYFEIFGSNLVYADANYCPGYTLSEDRATYKIGTGCGGTTDNYDLLYKSSFYYLNGNAYAEISVGSIFIGDPGVIYNDFYSATDKKPYKTIADFASAEEFTAFSINADNASNFATYSLRFQADAAGNYRFIDATKVENREPATPGDVHAYTQQECQNETADGTCNDTPAPAEVTPTVPSEPAPEASSVQEDYGDDISYETDPDAPPCPRSNPYARCVE